MRPAPGPDARGEARAADGRIPRGVLLERVRLGVEGPTVDVLIADGVVAEIGDLSRSGDEQILDVAGATVLPGFVDGHVHSVQWATSRVRIDVGSAQSPYEAVELLRAALSGRGDDDPYLKEVTLAYGFRDALWSDPAHKELLDAALPDRAVAVMSHDLHAMWISSAGLARIGWDHPTGLLREQDCIAARFAIAEQESVDVVDQRVIDATHALAAVGVTAMIDFEFADNVTDWARRSKADQLVVQVRASIWEPWLDAAIERDLRTGDHLPDGGGMVEVGPFKIVSDGSLNTLTAYCYDPYPDDRSRAEPYGLQLIADEELVALMTKANRHGFSPAVHAIGDRANSVALAAFEQVGCAGRIEHAQLVRPEDARRFARAGLVASIQPQHAIADRDVADHHWRGRTSHAFPYASLLSAGARLEFGSDAPVAEPNPWQAIAAAVARTDDGRPPWHPEQAIPLRDALTAAAAGRSTIQPGDPADLVLAAEDPAKVTVQDLRDMPVVATLTGGRVTFRADEPAGSSG